MLKAFLVLLGALGLAGVLFWWWSRKTGADIGESGAAEWTRLKRADPDLVAGLDEGRFVAAYRRVHFPRFPKYAFAMAAAFVAALPLTFGVLAGVAFVLGSLGVSPEAEALAQAIPVAGSTDAVARDHGETIALYYVQDVLRFYYFFGLLFVWLGVVFFAMRRYHQRRPGYLRDEILKEKAKES